MGVESSNVMPIPTYNDILEDPEYQNADLAKKKNINENYWKAWIAENPNDETGVFMQDKVISLFDAREKALTADPLSKRMFEHEDRELGTEIGLMAAARAGKYQTTEQFNAAVKAVDEELAPKRKEIGDLLASAQTAESEGTRRSAVIQSIGTGQAVKSMAGKTTGTYEAIRGELNDWTDSAAGAAEALYQSEGDIDKAIAINNKRQQEETDKFNSSLSMDPLNPFGIGMSTAAAATKFSPETTKRLETLKTVMQDLPQAEQKRIMKDAALSSAWTGDTKDRIRKLSTGELVINPQTAFGDKQGLIDEINTSDTAPANKELALMKLDDMRQRMSGKLYQAAAYGNELFNGFQGVVDPLLKEGVSREDALDVWANKQGDRWKITKVGDALAEGIREGTIGISKTIVGTGAGIASLWGGGQTLAEWQQGIQESQDRSEAASQQRGIKGGYSVTKDFFNSMTQMAPMFLGAAATGGSATSLATAVRFASVGTWAGAQGYESKLSDAARLEEQRQGRSLSAKEITDLYATPTVQIAALANGIQTAGVNYLMPGGAEAAALGRMTVTDFIAAGGANLSKSAAFKQSVAKALTPFLKHGSAEFVEEFVNQTLDKAISIGALGETMKLGDLIHESLYAGLMGFGMGASLAKLTTHDKTTDELETIANATVIESVTEENLPPSVLGGGPVAPPSAEDVAKLRAERDELAAQKFAPGTKRFLENELKIEEIDEQIAAYEEAQVQLPEVPVGEAAPENAVVAEGDAPGTGTSEAEAEAAVAPAEFPPLPPPPASFTRPSRKSADDITLGNLDQIVENGGGKLQVSYQGQEVEFDQFALGINGDEASVGKVKIADRGEASKGLGTVAYIKLGEELAARGITLRSDDSRLASGQALWKRLADQGYAQRKGNGYVFVSKQQTETTTTPTDEKSQSENQAQEGQVLTETAAGEKSPVAVTVSTKPGNNNFFEISDASGKKVGQAILSEHRNGQYLLDAIDVDEDQQKKGFGTALMKDVAQRLVARGASVLRSSNEGQGTVKILDRVFGRNNVTHFIGQEEITYDEAVTYNDKYVTTRSEVDVSSFAKQESPAPPVEQPTAPLPEGQPTSGDGGKPPSAKPKKVTAKQIKKMAPQLTDEEASVAEALFGPLLEDVEADLILKPADEPNGQMRLFQQGGREGKYRQTAKTPQDLQSGGPKAGTLIKRVGVIEGRSSFEDERGRPTFKNVNPYTDDPSLDLDWEYTDDGMTYAERQQKYYDTNIKGKRVYVVPDDTGYASHHSIRSGATVYVESDSSDPDASESFDSPVKDNHDLPGVFSFVAASESPEAILNNVAHVAIEAEKTKKNNRQREDAGTLTREDFWAKQIAIAKAKKGLFQNEQGPKGQIMFAADMSRAWIKLNKSGDISTLSHEIAHFMRQFILNPDNEQAMAAALRRGITKQEIENLAQWAGVKDGVWSVAAEEKFARAVERYLRREDDAPTKDLKPLFKKLSDWLKDIYTTIAGSEIDIEITPEVQAIFDKLFAGPQVKAGPQQQGTERVVVKSYKAPQPKQKKIATSETYSPKNAVSAAMRRKYGLGDRTDPAAQGFDDVLLEAEALLDKNKNAGTELITELDRTGRIATPVELALLMHEAAAADANAVYHFNKVTEGDTDSTTKYNDARIAYGHIIELLENQGTLASRALGFRRILVNRAFERVKLERQLIADNRGGPLSPEQKKRAADTAEKYKAADAEVYAAAAAKEKARQEGVARELIKREKKSSVASDAAAALKRLKDRAVVFGRKLFQMGGSDTARHAELEAKHNAGTITPEETAEAARIVAAAAKEAGFDIKAFHGTNREFTEFKASDGYVHFTDDRGQADSYAEGTTVRGLGIGTPRTVSVYLRFNNPLTKVGGRWTPAMRATLQRQMKEDNNDGLILKAFEDSVPGRRGSSFVNYYFATDPSQVKSADPFTGVPLDQRFQSDNPSILFQDSPLSDLDPEVVKDLVIFAKGFPDLEKFTSALTKEFGPESAPYASALFSSATASLKKAQRSPMEIARDLDPDQDLTGRVIANMVRGHLTLGTPESEILPRIHEELQQTVWPMLSLDEVREIYTNYGQVTFPSQEEISKKARALKALTLAEIKLEKLLKGLLPESTGAKRDPKRDEVRELEKLITNEYKKLGLKRETETQIKTPLDNIQTRIKNEIKDRQEAIKNRTPVPPKTDPVAYDAETTLLKNELDKVREEYAAIFDDPAATEAQKLARAIKALDRLITKEEEMAAAGILQNPARDAAAFTDPQYVARKQKLADLREARVDAYLLLHPKKTRAQILHDAALKAQRKGLDRDRQTLATGTLPARRVTPLPYSPSAELQAILSEREALADLIAELRKSQKPAKVPRDRTTQDIKATADSLAKLDAQILALQTGGTLPVRRTRTGTTNPVLKAIRDARKDRVKVLARLERAARQTKTPREQLQDRRIKALERSEKEYADKLAAGDFTRDVKIPEALNAAEQAAKFKRDEVVRSWNQARQADLLANATWQQKMFREAVSVLKFVRMMKLAGNFIPLLQVAPRTYGKFTTLQWRSYAKEFGQALTSGGSEQQASINYQRVVKSLEDAGFPIKFVRLLDPHNIEEFSKEDIPDMDILDRLAKWDPSIRHLRKVNPFLALQKIERVNQAHINVTRASMILQMLEWQGGIATEEDMKKMGKVAEVMTGRGQLGEGKVGKKLEAAIPWINAFALNSARWNIAQFQQLIMYSVWAAPKGIRTKALWHYYIAPRIGKVAFATLTSLLMGGGEDDKDEEERKRRLKRWYDITESSFGKVPLPRGASIDLGQGEGTIAHLMVSSIIRWERRKGGEKVRLSPGMTLFDGGELDDAPVTRFGTLDDKKKDFIFNRMNVVTGAIWRTSNWEQFDGSPATGTSVAKDFLLGLMLEDTYNVFRIHGWRGVLLWLEVLGGGSYMEPRPKKTTVPTGGIITSLFSTKPASNPLWTKEPKPIKDRIFK